MFRFFLPIPFLSSSKGFQNSLKTGENENGKHHYYYVLSFWKFRHMALRGALLNDTHLKVASEGPEKNNVSKLVWEKGRHGRQLSALKACDKKTTVCSFCKKLYFLQSVKMEKQARYSAGVAINSRPPQSRTNPQVLKCSNIHRQK